MRKQLSKFFIKVFLISLPILILLYIYIIEDPFKIIYNYDSFYKSGLPQYVTLDADYVSTETFIQNSKKYNYDSFIFGNSRTRFYEINSWKKYINSDNCYHFDGSAETLLGIVRKIDFLNRRHVKISNALIVLDYDILSQTIEKSGHLFKSHPAFTGQNRLLFQLEFFKAFLSKDFLFAYLDFKITKKFKPYMKNGHLLFDLPVKYIDRFNEIQYYTLEDQIKKDPASYYDIEKMKVFYNRVTVQEYYPSTIGNEQLKMLSEISTILKTNKTKYKVILNPLYDQKKLQPLDLKILENIFGKVNVYDFSGINSITNDFHNYYENSHYRPHIADSIMKNIYQ